MKTNTQFKSMGIVIALLLGIFMGSCTKEESLLIPEETVSNELMLKNGHVAPNYDDDIVECDLIGGQYIPVGKVIYSHDADNIYVTYQATGGWTLTELHLYVGSKANFEATCMNKTAIQIGKFPYFLTSGITNPYTFTVPKLGLPKDVNGYMIVAHAVVVNGDMNETAFANCTYNPLIMVKISTNKTSPEHWAVTQGDPFPAELIKPMEWCKIAGTNVYENPDTYLLKTWYGNDAADAMVYDNGTTLFITVKTRDTYSLMDSYVYVGGVEGLLALKLNGLDNNCINYPSLQYQKHTDATDQHDYSIPMLISNSQSFKEVFNSSRWGWLNYYNF